MSLCFPLGIDDFSKIRKENYYYVDKTGFIKELLGDPFEVNLITRPRRFGKTLTMSMMEDFFDIGRDSRDDFQGLFIYNEKELCKQWMNQWPTLFLTLKSVEGRTFESAYGMLKVLIAGLCKQYSFLEESSYVDRDDKTIFKQLKAQNSTPENLKDCLYTLTRMLFSHYRKPVIVLIDEYDVPLAKASDHGYYIEMLEIIRALFSNVLKTNKYLKFAVITGCLRISKESIFTGSNNFVANSISDNRFEEWIGFTQQDVSKLLTDAHFTDKMEEIRIWYDGYRFGSVAVYCPWDVLNHVAALQKNPDRMPQNYWENTSHNSIIRKFIDRRDLWKEEQINEDFEVLLEGGSIEKKLEENLTYDMIHSTAENLWSLLYLTGYLTKTVKDDETYDERGKTELRIPNEEIRQLFRTTVSDWFKDQMRISDRTELFDALWQQDEEKCSSILSDMIFNTISYHDYREDYYHAFMTGVLSFAGYKVKSNEERGEGRPDIILWDERRGRAMVIEIKRTDSIKKLEFTCEAAIRQIESRRYAEAFEEEYEEIIGFGICFYKKRCMVKSKRFR
ncbi:MAG: AAA family ATPase [Lachnospiraceae bacterium]|nr:AAA family ATPase [Lachnospiraceae bacterium]